jgi:lysophospholipase L1-like esterase
MTVMPQTQIEAQCHYFDLTKYQPVYSDSTGYGYDVIEKKKDVKAPYYFSVKVPDGNYKVTVELGSRRYAGETTVRAESRRLFVHNLITKKGQTVKREFIVNKRSPQIDGKNKVLLKEREKKYLDWDDRLTLEFNGDAPAVKSITIEPDTQVVTLFLCGNSTVVDQNYEPFTSWGQIITRWFDTSVAISNHAESGLTAGSFLADKRLDKIVSMMRPGDYVICEFGHNDQKEHRPGDGAWYNFQYNLKKFVDIVRAKQGNIIFVTPTCRRQWDESHQHIINTHGDYPDAMRDVARRENVPVIELQHDTKTLFETLGYDDSKRALVFYPMGSFKGQTRVLADNTHFNPYGAYEVAKMVVMGLKRLHLSLTNGLCNEWVDYDPSKPDDYNTFKWIMGPLRDSKKPDGN